MASVDRLTKRRRPSGCRACRAGPVSAYPRAGRGNSIPECDCARPIKACPTVCQCFETKLCPGFHLISIRLVAAPQEAEGRDAEDVLALRGGLRAPAGGTKSSRPPAAGDRGAGQVAHPMDREVVPRPVRPACLGLVLTCAIAIHVWEQLTRAVLATAMTTDTFLRSRSPTEEMGQHHMEARCEPKHTYDVEKNFDFEHWHTVTVTQERPQARAAKRFQKHSAYTRWNCMPCCGTVVSQKWKPWHPHPHTSSSRVLSHRMIITAFDIIAYSLPILRILRISYLIQSCPAFWRTAPSCQGHLIYCKLNHTGPAWEARRLLHEAEGTEENSDSILLVGAPGETKSSRPPAGRMVSVCLHKPRPAGDRGAGQVAHPMDREVVPRPVRPACLGRIRTIMARLWQDVRRSGGD